MSHLQQTAHDQIIDLRDTAHRHLDDLSGAIEAFRSDIGHLVSWGAQLAGVLLAGGRLLVAGNGGSAAQAQHLTAELVGRYQRERQPFSAISLHAETSSVTAIVNDYGADEAFARQVRAHGRQGDILLALSTSGTSRNVIVAAAAARERGLVTWALTGPGPNPLSLMVDSAISVRAVTPTVQEIHQVAVHVLCEEVDKVVLG